MTIHAQMSFWGFYPLNGEQSHRNPQKATVCAKARHMTYTVDR